jgi:hypothetical protein
MGYSILLPSLRARSLTQAAHDKYGTSDLALFLHGAVLQEEAWARTIIGGAPLPDPARQAALVIRWNAGCYSGMGINRCTEFTGPEGRQLAQAVYR